jgi:integrase
MSVLKKYRGKRITPKDKNWSKGKWYVWKRIDGKIIHRSIPEAQTKEEAEHAEREIIRAVFNKKYGIASKETFGEFVERVYKKYVRQNNVSLKTKDLYIRLLLGAFERRPLVDISPQDCRNTQAKFKARYSASTTNQLMSTASKIFNLAGEEGILDKNPMAFVKRLKEPPARDRLLSKEEWERLWAELEKDILLLHIVTLSVNLPLRRGQLLAITEDAVDFPTSRLYVERSKGRGARFVPLNSIATATLQSMIQYGELPFPLKETGLRKRWVRALSKAGIENFRFHDLRKTFASNLIKNNVNPEIVRQLFAHSSLSVTNAYTHSTSDDLYRAVKTLDEKPIQESDLVQ